MSYQHLKRQMGEVSTALREGRVPDAYAIAQECFASGGLTVNDMLTLLTKEEVATLRSYARSLQR